MTLAKIAVVGCGRPAQRWHLPTAAELAKRGRIEFVALCDQDEALAARAGRMFGVPHYSNIEQMLDRHRDIMAVDIVTGDPTHHALARIVAARGRHLMVEKPMAVTLPCCDAIINVCRENNVHFEVAENYFRMPKQRMIRQLVQAGVLGRIVRVHFVDPKARRPFQGAVEPRGLDRPVSKFTSYSGLCMDMGTHRLSQIRLYADSEPTRIAATVKRYRTDPEFVHEDWAHAMIEFESGAVGVYETSRFGEETLRYAQITGTEGMIADHDTFGPTLPLRILRDGEMQDVPVEFLRHRVDGVDVLRRIVVHTDPPMVYENPYADCAIDDWSVGHAEEIMSLANAAVSGAVPEYGASGRKDVEMAMAIYESSLHNMQPVELPITALTRYEQMLHDDFAERFGRAIV